MTVGQARFCRGVEFAASAADDPLIEAVRFVKEAFRSGKSLGDCNENALPTRWIPDKRRYLHDRGKDCKRLLPDRYEFLLYRHLRQGMEAGDIFCRDSVRFRSMKDDLLDDEQWQNKDKLIAEAGLDILQQPIEKHLADLKEQLETRIAEVNRGASPRGRMSTSRSRRMAAIRAGRWSIPAIVKR